MSILPTELHPGPPFLFNVSFIFFFLSFSITQSKFFILSIEIDSYFPVLISLFNYTTFGSLHKLKHCIKILTYCWNQAVPCPDLLHIVQNCLFEPMPFSEKLIFYYLKMSYIHIMCFDESIPYSHFSNSSSIFSLTFYSQ